MAEENKPDQPIDKVDKSEYDKVAGEKANLENEIEELRGEVMSQDYLDFLANKSKPKEEPAPKKDEAAPKSDATAEEIKALKAQIESMKADGASRETIQVQREIGAFRRDHADFDKIRPVMYGLSLDPKNADLSLKELYDKAKTSVKELAGTTEEEKERQRKIKGEKPGGDSGSFKNEKYDKMTPEEIAAETVAELGPIPKQ